MAERGRVVFDQRLLKSIRRRFNDLPISLLSRDLVRAYDDYGTLLHYAAKYGNVEMAKHLIKKGSDVDSLKTVGYTALMVAVQYRNPGVIRVLLQAGADIDISSASNQSVLQMIFNHEYSLTDSVFQVFLNKLKTDVISLEELVAKLIDRGCTLYHVAYLKNFNLIQGMINSGVNIESTGYMGRTGLHAAAELNDLALAKYLLSLGADVHALDVGGNHMILIAARYANKDFLQFLLEHGADPNFKNPQSEHTPLFEVLSRRDNSANTDECMKLLLQHGAIPHNPTHSFCTIFDCTLSVINPNRANYLIAQLAMIEKKGTLIDRSMIRYKLYRSDLSELVKYYQMCEQVLLTNMFQNLSLLNLLTDSEFKIKMYVRNEAFKSEIEEVCSEQQLPTLYPYYHDTLMKRIYAAVDLVELENTAIPVLCDLLCGNENKCYIAAKQTIGYLNKYDLEQLVRV